MEPTRPIVCAIMSPRRAAHLERQTGGLSGLPRSRVSEILGQSRWSTQPAGVRPGKHIEFHESLVQAVAPKVEA